MLTDLQSHELERTLSADPDPEKAPSPYNDHRRVDFHWMVRDRNALMWFSNLLNAVVTAQDSHSSHLDIRIQTYVTQTRKNISQHVFRQLLEKHRTAEHPASAVTGLVNPTHFGRPDIKSIMTEHYADMCRVLVEDRARDDKGPSPEASKNSSVRRKSAVDKQVRVGVFFCGPPVVGQQLADQCEQMTARARTEGRKIQYRFMTEVFG